MPIFYKSPHGLVATYTSSGLYTKAGRVGVKQYLSQNPKNGGNHNIASLIDSWPSKARPALDSAVGAERLMVLRKGQGRPEAFIAFMDHICANKDILKQIKFTVKQTGGIAAYGSIYDLYFANRSDQAALLMMVTDKFFGIDCIGFVANYLIANGYWSEYQGVAIDQWVNVFKKPVNNAADVQPLNILIWPGAHIAIIDNAYDSPKPGGKVKVDVCQSSSGGPQLNEGVYLTELSTYHQEKYRMYSISGGAPAMPVGGNCYILSMEGLVLNTQPFGVTPEELYQLATPVW